MSDKDRNAVETGGGAAAGMSPGGLDVDEHTTAPNATTEGDVSDRVADPGKWQMPKPKFQQTSGYLPQGYLKDMQAAAEAAKASPGSEDTTREHAMPQQELDADPIGASTPLIEPQPDLSEQLIEEEPLEAAVIVPPETKRGAGALFLGFGVLAIVAFLAIFLALVYFLFLAPPSSNTNF
ncbi:MAG TPA: hypothetical protein PKD26_12825 [Pyrinomonadaceae bacterium]|nr:hypothetical protein [Pyrinomonadaceae bacterium]